MRLPLTPLLFIFIVSTQAFARPIDLYGLCMGLRSGDPMSAEAKHILSGKALDQELDAALKDADRVRDAACIIAETKRPVHLGALLQVRNEHLVPEVFSALIRIISPKNEEQIRTAMKSWIQSPNREDHILKTLGTLQVLGAVQPRPTMKDLEGLLESAIPEVRMGSHDFLFQRFDQLSGQERQELMKAALKRDPLQVRVSALRTFRALKDREKKALQIDLKDCRKDPEPEVREECP
jgi:hypothetical protein